MAHNCAFVIAESTALMMYIMKQFEDPPEKKFANHMARHTICTYIRLVNWLVSWAVLLASP